MLFEYYLYELYFKLLKSKHIIQFKEAEKKQKENVEQNKQIKKIKGATPKEKTNSVEKLLIQQTKYSPTSLKRKTIDEAVFKWLLKICNLYLS